MVATLESAPSTRGHFSRVVDTPASAAIPLLKAAVDSPYRQVQSVVGNTAIIEDEAWIDTCAEALARILGRRE